MFAQQGARPLVAYGHMGTFAMVTETIDVTADYTIRF